MQCEVVIILVSDHDRVIALDQARVCARLCAFLSVATCHAREVPYQLECEGLRRRAAVLTCGRRGSLCACMQELCSE
jgi:hypothetical protein